MWLWSLSLFFKIFYCAVLTLLVRMWDGKTPPWWDEWGKLCRCWGSSAYRQTTVDHGKRNSRWGCLWPEEGNVFAILFTYLFIPFRCIEWLLCARHTTGNKKMVLTLKKIYDLPEVLAARRSLVTLTSISVTQQEERGRTGTGSRGKGEHRWKRQKKDMQKWAIS